MKFHEPVLLHESIDGLNIIPGGTYLDLTYGGGGHSKLILEKLGNGKLIAFDQDDDAEANFLNDERLIFFKSNYRYFNNFLRLLKIDKVDGILADLGVSSHHFNSQERGFSFRFDSPLDMRMNSNQKLNAAEILNEYEPEELKRIFRDNGELNNAFKIANMIVTYRSSNQIRTTGDLEKAIKDIIPKTKENTFLAKIYQAIRIEVNNEIGVLKEMLQKTPLFMNNKARLVIISYHSLEDKLVKNFIRSGNFEGKIEKDIYGNYNKIFNQVNSKVIVPSESEIRINNRARSAKMRIAERIYE